MEKEYLEVWTHTDSPPVKIEVPRGTNHKLVERGKGSDLEKEIVINF